jgi:hypothetical protein
MEVTTKKNGVSVIFCHKLTIFTKTHRILSKKLNFFKTRKNSYTAPLWITDTEYQGHDHEIHSFDQFLSQAVDFR